MALGGDIGVSNFPVKVKIEVCHTTPRVCVCISRSFGQRGRVSCTGRNGLGCVPLWH